MYRFSKQQKVILGVLTAIISGFICYYVYAKENTNVSQLQLENNLEVQKEETKETQEYSDETILVHVSGAVNKEGVVELKTDSRILDAIEKAGGVTKEAVTDAINLAYPLEDGMKIHIPTKQEKEKEVINSTKESVIISNGVSIEKEGNKNAKVNINTATQTQLETLQGIGPSTAIKIINYRKEKGKFNKIEEIKEINGIGETKFEKIKDFICVK